MSDTPLCNASNTKTCVGWSIRMCSDLFDINAGNHSEPKSQRAEIPGMEIIGITNHVQHQSRLAMPSKDFFV